MLLDVLRMLYGYNSWATNRIFDMAAQLTPEQLLAPGGAGHGSVRDTLVHIISTQRSWLSWWDGSLSAAESIRLRLDPADFPDLASLRSAWEDVERNTMDFIAGLGGADVDRVYVAQLPNGEWRLPLWRMMLHVANHGTQHRSEVAAMLTGFGHSPGDLDLLFYR